MTLPQKITLFVVFLTGILVGGILVTVGFFPYPKDIPKMVFDLGEGLCKGNKGFEKVKYYFLLDRWEWYCNNGMRSSKDTINDHKPTTAPVIKEIDNEAR